MAAIATRTTAKSFKDSYQAQNASQGRGLALVQGSSGDDYLATASVANSIVIGVQEEASGDAGDPISCIQLGDAVAIAGAAINAGQFVKCTANGQFVPVTSEADNIAGRAKSSASTQGDEFILFVSPSVFSVAPAVPFMGAYSAGTAYVPGNIVSYSGSSYICIQAGTGKEPDTQTAYWSVLALVGATGATGATGAIGAQGPTGPAGINWRGAWSSSNTYAIGDAVSYSGSSYIAVQAGSNKEPDTQTTYWNVLAAGA
jgi:predicted RecA/RadA family phage recombinase